MAVTVPVVQLGAELRARRKADGLSLRDVEAATGVSLSTLSRIERGHVPDLALISKLAEWLGVNVQAGSQEIEGIQTDEDVMKVIEVHLRANKNLDENVARAIAKSCEVVMRLELERAQKRSG